MRKDADTEVRDQGHRQKEDSLKNNKVTADEDWPRVCGKTSAKKVPFTAVAKKVNI